MAGWIVPPPKAPTKSPAQYAGERRRKVRWLEAQGLLESERLSRMVTLNEVLQRRDLPYELELTQGMSQ